jgi:20S proteasome alpha/beta subunit
MTLLIGIKCTDGIVMAADGAATFGNNLGTNTIRQPVRKLEIVNNRMIVGVTGAIGLQQRFVGELGAQNISSSTKRHQVMELLANALRKPLRNEFEMAEAAKGALGNAAINGVLSGTLIALLVEGHPTLIQFSHQGSPECATESLRFVSLGSGQPLADPFLAFLRRIFWETKPPTLEDGIFACVWALVHAIKTNPGGVDEPIQIMTLRLNNNAPEIREIAAEELQEHREFITSAETKIAETITALLSASVGKADEIPQP